MKKIVVIVFLSLVFFACSSSKKNLVTNINTTPTQISEKDTSSEAKDGLSYQNAIFINEKSETAGVVKEYDWLKKTYPGYSIISQSLNNYKGKFYDIIKIKTADGVEKSVYFDISKFFGKF